MTGFSNFEVSVCICTFRRPDLLNTLLHSLLNDNDYDANFEIIVVDNDAQKTAASVVGEYATAAPATFQYLCEPEQNIAIARNRAVAAASGRWIAMIDDDERPDRNWLGNLVQCASTWNADAIFGPVIPVYPHEAPEWIRRGGFLEKRRLPHGAPMPRGETRTSNVIFRRELILDIQGPFDPKFGLTGGEDSHLFDRLVLEKRRLFWCNNALVYEVIPISRMTAQWLLKRSFRTGQTFGRLFLDGFGIQPPKLMSKAAFLCRALAVFPGALLAWIVTLPFGRIVSFRCLKTAATQLGKLSALTPYQYEEYSVGSTENSPPH